MSMAERYLNSWIKSHNGQVLVIDGGEDAIELLLLLKQQFRKVFVGGLGFHVPEIALSQTRSR